MFKLLNDIVIFIRNLIILIAILRFFGYTLAQTENVNVEFPETVVSERLGSICIYVPKTAADEMATNNPTVTWDVIVRKLLVSQGVTEGMSHLLKYDDYPSLFKMKSRCDYNIYVVDGDSQTINTEYAVQLLLNKWLCTEYNFDVYFYEQQQNHYLHYTDVGTCAAVACPLDSETLGIGCVSNDITTYETVSDDSAFIDLVDGVRYRMNISTNAAGCYYEDCEIIGTDPSAYLVIATKSQQVRSFDDDLDPISQNMKGRAARFNFKKWWDLFYKVVQVVNQIVQGMSKRVSNSNYMQQYYK